MPVKILAFDLDGTLVDSVLDLAAALNKGLAEVGLKECALDDVRSFVGNGARMLATRAVAHAVEQQSPPAALVDDVLRRFHGHYEQVLVGNTHPFAGIPEALAELRARAPAAGFAVATNKPGKFARPLVDALMPGVFGVVVGPDDAGSLKPDPAIVRHVERALGGTVVAFVGDSGVDVETARNAGVLAVGVAWGLKPDELGAADVVARTPADLVRILSELVR